MLWLTAVVLLALTFGTSSHLIDTRVPGADVDNIVCVKRDRSLFPLSLASPIALDAY